jgi:hypothetical protein
MSLFFTTKNTVRKKHFNPSNNFMRAIKVNPVSQTVEGIFIPTNEFKDVKKSLESNVAAHAIFLPSGDSMYVNPFSPSELPTFFFEGFPQKEVRGHAIIVFSDNSGHHDVRATIDQIKSLVTFLPQSKSL